MTLDLPSVGVGLGVGALLAIARGFVRAWLRDRNRYRACEACGFKPRRAAEGCVWVDEPRAKHLHRYCCQRCRGE